MKSPENIRLPGPLGELPQDAQARILAAVPLTEILANGGITPRGLADMFRAAKAEYADPEMDRVLDQCATAVLCAGLHHKHSQK